MSPSRGANKRGRCHLRCQLVARAEHGQAIERVGPAQDLIATYLSKRLRDDTVTASHATLAKVLEELISGEAPPHVQTAYASRHLSEHLAAAGRTTKALAHLPELSTPADNLALWQTWHSRLEALGPDHPDTLTTRSNIASWTGQTGNPAEAPRLYRAAARP